MAKRQQNDPGTKDGDLLTLLEKRFQASKNRHPKLSWQKVRERIEAHPSKRAILEKMEETGGEPDLFEYNTKTGACFFVDMAEESPHGRRSLCYDKKAWEDRKANKPAGSAEAMAKEWGAELLDEQTYLKLQSWGPFDLKTSSWIATPADIREKGGALFGDHRFGRSFIYHNGAESYYAARGFRVGIWI